VTGDTNAKADVFLFDRQTSTTTRVSVASDGTQANNRSYYPDISADGRYITYESLASNLVPGDTNNQDDVFVFDRQTGITTRISVFSDGTQAWEGSNEPVISPDGRFIAYSSAQDGLASGDTNNARDVLLFDRLTNTTSQVAVTIDGSQPNSYSYGPSISDGRFVAYESNASNLVTGDTNGALDIFLFDRLA
jgi:Tol biopolymer transport system component